MCIYCDEPTETGDYDPCCANSSCEALFGDVGMSMCVHCGAEMFQEDGVWYHHSQSDYPVEKRYLQHSQQSRKET